ncbi:Basic-leucine zipper domain [Sesbania bispinosa]|nr:Basic-leucine zipper domain [Sesbania bispinosa]
MMQSPPPSALIPGNYQLNKEFGELDPSVLHYFTGAQANPSSVQDQRQNTATPLMRRSTLNIFPSQPMHTVPTLTNSKGKMESVSLQACGSKAPSNPPVELTKQKGHVVPVTAFEPPKAPQPDNKNKGSTSSSEHQVVRIEDKAIRRLAQNREAARKSRLRKKVNDLDKFYIYRLIFHQLESSRVRLGHLEQEVQRLRAQVIFLGGNAALGGEQGVSVPTMNNSCDSDVIAAFDLEYAKWVEEHQRRVGELRTAFHNRIPDHELRMVLDNCLTHFDQVMNLRAWPSEIFKIVLTQIEPLSDQQVLAICALQQTTHEAEDSIILGVDNLNQAMRENLSSGTLTHTPNMNNYMSHIGHRHDQALRS